MYFRERPIFQKRIHLNFQGLSVCKATRNQENNAANGFPTMAVVLDVSQ
jgi:hypothetical protein